MPRFTHHIFVCCNQRPAGSPRGCCDPEGSERLRNAFKAEVKRRGLEASVRANASGCLDQCECGPTMVIYPEGIWYGRVTLEDVARIIDQTIVRGQLLPDLLIPDDVLNTRKGFVRRSGPSCDGCETGEPGELTWPRAAGLGREAAGLWQTGGWSGEALPLR
jgi:(2Fe-2S) ferredoxin